MDKQQLSPTEPQQQLSSEQKQALNKQLLTAVRFKNESTVKKLIADGVDVNSQNQDGISALMVACYDDGKVEMAKILIGKGASVNAKDKSGNTALTVACGYGKVEMAKFLIENGASMNAVDGYGNTALMLACYNDNLEMAKILIGKGADVSAVDINGETALMLACRYGKVEMAKILIENNADVNSQNKSGNTPLMVACSYGGKVDIVKFLIAKGAYVNGQELDALRYFDIQELKELAKSLLESEYLNNKTDKTNNLSEERKNKLLEQKCQTKEDSIKFITELCKSIKASRLLIMQIKAMRSPASKMSSAIYRTEIPLHIANEILYDCNTQEDNSQKNNSL